MQTAPVRFSRGITLGAVLGAALLFGAGFVAGVVTTSAAESAGALPGGSTPGSGDTAPRGGTGSATGDEVEAMLTVGDAKSTLTFDGTVVYQVTLAGSQMSFSLTRAPSTSSAAPRSCWVRRQQWRSSSRGCATTLPWAALAGTALAWLAVVLGKVLDTGSTAYPWMIAGATLLAAVTAGMLGQGTLPGGIRERPQGVVTCL